jgi:hypothetical protein
MTSCWPSGPPAIGTTADGTVALAGTAVCYTMAITAERQ